MGESPGERADVDLPEGLHFEASFLADPAAISPVRRRLRVCLEAAGLEEIAADAALACQELMANAVVHGCRNLPPSTELTVTAAWSDHRLRVAVRDPSEVEPREQRESTSRPSGRGMQLVSALCDRWGVESSPSGCGKSVWMEIAGHRTRRRGEEPPGTKSTGSVR